MKQNEHDHMLKWHIGCSQSWAVKSLLIAGNVPHDEKTINWLDGGIEKTKVHCHLSGQVLTDQT